jgi:hypothetical protein
VENTIQEKGEAFHARNSVDAHVATTADHARTNLAQSARMVPFVHIDAAEFTLPSPAGTTFTVQVTWEWKGFTSSARPDGLMLKHWVKARAAPP